MRWIATQPSLDRTMDCSTDDSPETTAESRANRRAASDPAGPVAQSTDGELSEAFRAIGARIVSTPHGAGERESADQNRGRSLYDWWSHRRWLYDVVMGLTRSMRADAYDVLEAETGETVLDLACGPGTNFERLRQAVGPSGTVIGLDYSSGMIGRAIELVDERGWDNVHVVRADAADTCGPDGVFDAVITTFALHTFLDATAALKNVHDALAPEGRFVVLDSRPLTDGPARFLNPIYECAIARAVNHQRGQDTLNLLRRTFPDVRVVETYDAGAGYLAVARPTGDG